MEGERIIFKKIILLGTGKIAVECLRLFIGTSYDISAIEQEEQTLSFVRLLSGKHGFAYNLINDEQELLTYLSKVEEEALLISVNNNYIFPQQLLKKINLTIINFHNALLPNYPGRNAPTWVIFNEERITGITWHIVEEGVDSGKILMQKTIAVDPLITALELTKQCMDAGIEAFRQILPDILAGRFVCHAQDEKQRKNFHWAKEIPNHGCMDVSWPTTKVSAFLRSLDYGRINIFPPPKVVVLGQEYLIRKYGILSEATLGYHVSFGQNEMMLQDYGQKIRIMLEKGGNDERSHGFTTGN